MEQDLQNAEIVNGETREMRKTARLEKAKTAKEKHAAALEKQEMKLAAIKKKIAADDARIREIETGTTSQKRRERAAMLCDMGAGFVAGVWPKLQNDTGEVIQCLCSGLTGKKLAARVHGIKNLLGIDPERFLAAPASPEQQDVA